MDSAGPSKGLSESPYFRSNWFSKLYFLWTIPLFRTGLNRPLELEDTYQNPPDSASANLGRKLLVAWQEELLRKQTPNLFAVVIRVFRWRFFSVSCLYLINFCFFRVGLSLLIGYLIRAYEGDYRSNAEIAVTLMLICCSALFITFFHQSLFQAQTLGMQIRIALSYLIYQKTLCLSQLSLSTESVGQVTNLLSNDVNRFDRYLEILPFLFVSPVQLVVVSLTLYNFVGPAVFAGLAYLLFLIPLQGGMGRLFSRIRRSVAEQTDLRVRLMNEIINGMVIIKFLTWEQPFARQVTAVRTAEIKNLRRRGRFDSLNRSVFDTSSKIVVIVTLATYMFTGHILTAATVYTTMSVLECIRIPVTNLLPLSITGLSEIRVCLQRIQEFLQAEERNVPTPVEELEHGHLTFSQFSTAFTLDGPWVLENINLDVLPGELVGVVGQVGSGKSSLLLAMLQELPPLSGHLRRGGVLAYASQNPTIFSRTVQENILFGRPMRKEWYRRVLEACALLPDLQLMPNGDLTLVGDRGAVLSGGQKARINLARAVYSEADIYLLDDPLSAVDTRVGRHIFDEVITGLLKGGTVIIVTHLVHFLDKADKIVILNRGLLSSCGTYAQLQAELNSVAEDSAERARHSILTVDEIEDTQVPLPTCNADGYGTFEKPVSEQRTEGRVRSALYRMFFFAGNSVFGLVAFLITVVLSQAFSNGSDFWLKIWIGNQSSNGILGLSEIGCFEVYGLLVTGFLIASIFKYNLLFFTCLNSTETLHRRLFSAILRAPMRFFEQNSVGRVIYRFVNDVGSMDENIPQLLAFVVQFLSLMAGLVVVLAVLSWATIPGSILFVCYIFYARRFYLITASSLKRLEAIGRSPVFGHLNSSLYGLTTIRAFRMESTFLREFCTVQDAHTGLFNLTLAVTQTLGVFVDTAGFLYIVYNVALFYFASADGATLGLALTTLIAFVTGSLSWGITQAAELGNQFVSVERVIEYANVEPEAPLRIKGMVPPADWPQRGKIQFERIYLDYGKGPSVLQVITCTIQPKEKVGIVGRTGAGKTSLISTLFRVVEPSSGSLHIDNVDVLGLGLHDLRSRIAIIPQDPVLFIGTIRRNLDPLQTYSDEEIWTALNRVQLVDRLDQGLDTEVSQGGVNFSQGERQLICLARAIISAAHILILDEATAHLDAKTDAIIQRVVRKEFNNSTILTVAHRLETVMDNDRILLMENGEIIEFDEPYKLLSSPASRLNLLVQRTGTAAATNLFQIAVRAHDDRLRHARAKDSLETT